MKIKRTAMAAAAALMFCAMAASSRANTLTFDNTGATSGTGIPPGYAGFTWSNFDVINGTQEQSTTGYYNGVVSSPDVAYNGFGAPASISSTTDFTLVSGYFTSAFFNQSVTVAGYSGSTKLDSVVLPIKESASTLETFNWSGLTQVTFTSSATSEFVLDNLTVNLASTPLPASGLSGAVLLACLGGVRLGVRRAGAGA